MEWLARERELDDALAARVLWQEADRGGSPIAATRMGQMCLADGDPATAVTCFRRAAVRGDAGGLFALHELLLAKPALRVAADEASIALTRAVELGHPAACRVGGLAAEARRAFTDAERLFERASRGNDTIGLERLGALHGKWGETDKALEFLRRAVAAGSGEAKYRLALTLDVWKHQDEVVQLLTEADLAGVVGAAGELGLVEILVRGRPASAFEAVRFAEPDDALAMWVETILHVHNQAPAEARKALDRVAAARADHDTFILLSAVVSEASGDEATAVERLSASSETERDYWLLASVQPWLESLADRSAVAAFYLADIGRLESDTPDTGTPEAECLRPAYERAAAMGSRAAAEWAARYARLDSSYRASLELAITKGSTWALLALANLNLDEGQSEEQAAQYLNRAAELGDSDALLNLGLRLSESEPERAANLLDAALDAGKAAAADARASLIAQEKGWDHPDVEAMLSYGAMLGSASATCRVAILEAEVKNDLEEAHRLFARADRMGDAEGSDGLGLTLERTHRYTDAELAYRRAIERGMDVSRTRIANVFVLRGEFDEAYVQATRALPYIDSGFNAALILGETFEKCARAGHGPPEAALEHALACYRHADTDGSAWAAIHVSRLAEGQEAINALERARRRANDPTDPQWHLVSDREFLARLIAEREREMPKFATPTRRTSRARTVGFTVRFPPHR